ncbi:MAG: DUF262 domain-containing protein [Methanococcaceae archaeon]
MANLENAPKNYSVLVNEISTGQVKIPQFQRQFVWDMVASAKLLDSILKGYPIGTFIFWRTNEQLRAIRNIGKIKLPDQNHNEFVNYVLDGQQRLTSFYAAVKGEEIERENGKTENFANIYIDLDANEEQDIVIIDISKKEPCSFIKLTDIMEGDFTYLGSFPPKYQNQIRKYQGILKGYNFNVINLKDASIDVATEVFTRLNVGGKALSLFEIMVAKTYDSIRKFDLAEKYLSLCKSLETAGYEDISSATVLQILSIFLTKDCSRKQILKLDKKEIIDIWDDAVESLHKAIDFLRCYGVVVSRLLPYNAILVPFSFFFYKNKKNPTGETKKMMEDFFWRAALGQRYSSAVESKLAQDIQKIDKILTGELPKYEWSIDISPESLKKIGYFSTGRSFIKAILCLYAMKKPKSFNTNLDVIIDNSYLKVSTSKNYHHFFPKAYMNKNHPEIEYWKYNNILNITIVDAQLNKNDIRTKSPSKYMKAFKKVNEEIDNTMKTHLINDLEKFGIWFDDYEKFFTERAKIVSKELKKLIIEQETGSEEQLEPVENEEGTVSEE